MKIGKINIQLEDSLDRKRRHDWVENVDFLRQQIIGANGKKRKLTVGMPPCQKNLIKPF